MTHKPSDALPAAEYALEVKDDLDHLTEMLVSVKLTAEERKQLELLIWSAKSDMNRIGQMLMNKKPIHENVVRKSPASPKERVRTEKVLPRPKGLKCRKCHSKLDDSVYRTVCCQSTLCLTDANLFETRCVEPHKPFEAIPCQFCTFDWNKSNRRA